MTRRGRIRKVARTKKRRWGGAVETRTFAEGDYTGELKDNKRNGYGRMVYAVGDVYEGEWQDDEKEGYGRMVYAVGDVYEGEWKDDEKEGNGTMEFMSGSVYQGEWKNGHLCGKGTFVFANKGGEYTGDFKDDKANGFGKMVYANRNVYEGEWKDDEKDGYGRMDFASGSVYKGEWKNGHLCGKGKFIFANKGGEYEGEYKDDKANGFGRMVYANGSVYEGEFNNNERHGYGKFVFAKGVYEGEFKNGKANGNGLLVYANRDEYEGEWKNDKKDGTGKMVYENGDVYEGEWKNDIMDSGFLTKNNIMFRYIKGKKVKIQMGRSQSVTRKTRSPTLSKTQRSQFYSQNTTDLLYGIGDKQETVRESLRNPSNRIVINTEASDNPLVFDVETIEYYLKPVNRSENWFFECLPDGSINEKKPYVSFLVGTSGYKGLIAVDEVEQMVKNKKYNPDKIFTVTKIKKFQKTRSWGASNLAGPNINYVSANHCQDGTSYDVYSSKPVMFSNIRVSPPPKKKDIS